MGPNNIALVKLFDADQAMREVQERLDTVSKNVRLQERKLADIEERLKLAHHKLQTQQSQGALLDLDIQARDTRIDRLRTQQQTAKTNNEYQTFLTAINTEKADKAKVEEQSLLVMEQVESLGKETADLTAQQAAESEKLGTMRSQINDKVAALQAEMDVLKPARESAWAAVPDRQRSMFERLAERYEGEALSALLKPRGRVEEYICTACHMDLVVDVYNKLHTRDDLVFCPSCGRMLYIPDDLPPETALNKKIKKAKKEEKSEPTPSA